MDIVRKSYQSTSLTPLESKKITLIWAKDGWCYSPELKTRQYFTEKNGHLENWTGVIAMPEHIEQVTWTLFSQAPKMWREQAESYDEMFEEIQTTKSNKRPSRS